nr:MAG TPA: Flavin-dependent thymidylate synthase [Crassvirales sp.]
MSEIIRMERATLWKRALNAARRTIGKEPLNKEPSKSWRAKMLLAEHSPIRLVEFEWTWKDIMQWVTTHLVRHHEGCEKFVHTQRGDRRAILDEYNVSSRNELPQGATNDMDMTANAQALISISRKRLCNCASKETREAWKQVQDAIREVDPVMADKMVPECIYRGFCPEFMNPCGYANTEKYKQDLERYRNTNYN